MYTPRVVKTLSIEDIYADPHALDSYLESKEPVAVMRNGREVATFVPKEVGGSLDVTDRKGAPDYRARFLKMWGPDAFKSDVSVAEEIAELRRGRNL